MTTFSTPTFSVQYNHSTIDDSSSMTNISSYVTGIATHHAHDADCGTCTLTMHAYPSGFAENDHVVVTINSATVFNGRMARPAVQYYDTWQFSCEDLGANLAFLWGGEGTDPELDALKNRVYTSQTDGAIITNIAEAMAVPVSLHSITDAGKTLATVYDIVLRVGQSGWSLIRGDQGIDVIFGYWTACNKLGVIKRSALAPAGSADFTAVEGTNILLGSNRQPLGTESIINRYIVYGYDTELGTIGGVGVGDYALSNSNIPTPPTSHTATIRNPLIEDDTQALATATLQVGLHNFPYDETNLVLLGDSSIDIGQTVSITSTTGPAKLDHSGDKRFVAAVEHIYSASTGYITKVKAIRTA